MFRSLFHRSPTPLQLPELPFSLGHYLRLRGYDPAWATYTKAVSRQVAAKSLDRYEKLQTGRNQIGRGSAKDCYAVDDRSVLLVNSRQVLSVQNELAALALLESAGFPVVKTFKAGTVKSRYANGDGSSNRDEAMVQERLSHFVTFERSTPAMTADFLAAPSVNRNTLASLVAIRRLVRQHGVAIGDLQGGLRPDGTFVIADPTGAFRLDGGDFRRKEGLKNLDRLIHAVAAKLGR